MTAELGIWAGAIGAAIHGAEATAGRTTGPRSARAGRAMTDPAYQPHYRQIEQALRERITALRPGDRLPSDAELCAEFGVSRMTARARDAAARGGRPHPARARAGQLRGRAARPSPGQPADDLQPGDGPRAAASRARGVLDPGHPAVDSPPRPRASASRSGEPIVHLRRLRLADDEPIALESAVLIGATAPRRDDRRPRERGSLHEALRGGRLRRSGAAPGRSLRPRRRPRTPDCSPSGRGDPLLVERRVIADVHGRRIEATESRYPADRYAPRRPVRRRGARSRTRPRRRR